MIHICYHFEVWAPVDVFVFYPVVTILCVTCWQTNMLNMLDTTNRTLSLSTTKLDGFSCFSSYTTRAWHQTSRRSQLTHETTLPSSYHIVHGAVSSTGVHSINVDSRRWTVEASTARSFRNSKAPWSLGACDSFVESSRSECPILRGTHCSGEDSKGLVFLLFFSRFWRHSNEFLGTHSRTNMPNRWGIWRSN